MFLLRRALGLVTTAPNPSRGADNEQIPVPLGSLADISDEPEPTTEELRPVASES